MIQEGNIPPPTIITSSTTTLASCENNNNNNNNNIKNSETNSRQKLRCPRCDSTNTKFCYYNNYNLTQPRHFCKSCRRYWTKGGTLRNVPIGGGCRKNKSPNATALAAAKAAKAAFSTEMLISGNTGFLGPCLLDQQHAGPSPTPNPWGLIPQGQSTSPILALLRGANPTQIGSISSNSLGLGLDLYGNGAPSLFGSSNQHQLLNGLGLGDPDIGSGNNGCNYQQELYHKLKLSAGNYNNYCGNNNNENQGGASLSHGMTSSLSSPSSGVNSTILEMNNLASYGLKNSPISSWFEFPIVPNCNGAFS